MNEFEILRALQDEAAALEERLDGLQARCKQVESQMRAQRVLVWVMREAAKSENLKELDTLVARMVSTDDFVRTIGKQTAEELSHALFQGEARAMLDGEL